MKVCLALQGAELIKKELMALDFYKAEDYCICDIETKEMVYFTLDESTGSYLSINDMVEKGVEAIITPNLRPMAGKILLDNGIVVYKSMSETVEENIRFFSANRLPEFTSEMVEAEGDSCGSSCSSCKSTSCK